MRNVLFCLPLFSAALIGSSVAADEPGYAALMAEAAWDWHPGDMIFRNGINDIDELVRDAEVGQWASVGLLRSSSGGPRVVYADQKFGVTEVMLDDFIDGLSEDEYSVYRIESIDTNVPGEQMEQGPMMKYSLFVLYGFEHDDRMIMGNGHYYNAELPYMAALNSGVVLGVPISGHLDFCLFPCPHDGAWGLKREEDRRLTVCRLRSADAVRLSGPGFPAARPDLPDRWALRQAGYGLMRRNWPRRRML